MGDLFALVDNAQRGEVMGGEWSANPCVYPYVHSERSGNGNARLA